MVSVGKNEVLPMSSTTEQLDNDHIEQSDTFILVDEINSHNNSPVSNVSNTISDQPSISTSTLTSTS